MCPRPPKSIYLDIVDNPDVPEDIRAAAQDDIAQIPLQEHLSDAVSGSNGWAMVDVPLPFIGATDFACSIHTIVNQVFDARKDPQGIEVNPKDPHKVQLPGLLMKASWGYEPDTTDERIALDQACQLTYDGFQATWNFYKECFGRNSIDDNGMEIRATIHLNKDYGGAFWLGSARAMFFGDAGTNHHPLNVTYSLDVIGHELTHGVIGMTAALGEQQDANSNEEKEALSLNESIADCFGVMIKQYQKKQTAQDGDWEMVTGWWDESTVQRMNWPGSYMRTFRDVDRWKQPDQSRKHMTKLLKWEMAADPHENAGIPSRAFYEAAQLFQGHTWDNVGKIWYNALHDPVLQEPQQQTFKGWAKLTTQHAKQLFGQDGETKLRTAWGKVGIKI